MNKLCWVGSSCAYLDEIDIKQVGAVTLGRLGGTTAGGQTKNEDGCLILSSEAAWEFVLLMDAHYGAESAELVASVFESRSLELQQLAESPDAFSKMTNYILAVLQDAAFMERCRKVKGETACLFCFRKGKHLWWLSVGDCLVYLFHPELARLGEYQQNHRSFYEWIGHKNTMATAVPSFSTGVKELRQGENRILLMTDGLIECPGTAFCEPEIIHDALMEHADEQVLRLMLKDAWNNQVRDSCTCLLWTVTVLEKATIPSDEKDEV